MTNYREILRLHIQGISQRSIAASCSCSRNTVSKVLQRANEMDASWPLKENMMDSELHRLLFSEVTMLLSRRRVNVNEFIVSFTREKVL